MKTTTNSTRLTAVVRGAAIFGIEKPTNKALSTMTPCPQYFGVSVSECFSEIRHPPEDRVVDPVTRMAMAKDQLLWLIKKEDLILSDDPRVVEQQFTKMFSATGLRKGEIPIYAYRRDDVPERFTNAGNGKLVFFGHYSML